MFVNAPAKIQIADHGDIATVFESRGDLQTMLLEVQEYFDLGASLSRGATVVDVGANIGAFAIEAAKRCDGDLCMFCVEPVPPLFKALECNLRENRWLAAGSHLAFNVALTTPEEAGTSCEFYYFRRFPRDSTMSLERKRMEFEEFFAERAVRLARAGWWLGPGARLAERVVRVLPKGRVGRWLSDRVTGLERIQVPRSTVSEILSAANPRRIDLLKIDVEGAEAKVLAGIDSTTWNRIQQVVVESDGADESTRDVVSILTAQGFRPAHVAPSPLMVARGLKNVLIYASK